MTMLDGEYGYDGFWDYLYVEYINSMDTLEEKLSYIKSLYLEDEKKYTKWKQWCR